MSSRKNTNETASTSRSNRNKDECVTDPNANDDKLFEPSLEMMVNDFDDESTLELEEKMASTEAQDPNAELNSLQRVSNTVNCANDFNFRHMMKFIAIAIVAGRRYANRRATSTIQLCHTANTNVHVQFEYAAKIKNITKCWNR